MVWISYFKNNQKSAINQNGFTLIELLVVIAIIGILSSLAMVSLNDARLKAYDAQIKGDIAQLRTSLELYASDHDGSYVGWAPGSGLKPPACSGNTDYGYGYAANDIYYVIYADLCDQNGYFCLDFTGLAQVISEAPTGNDCIN